MSTHYTADHVLPACLTRQCGVHITDRDAVDCPECRAEMGSPDGGATTYAENRDRSYRDVLVTIDEALAPGACPCGADIPPGSVSLDWCSDTCQQEWTERITTDPKSVYNRPDATTLLAYEGAQEPVTYRRRVMLGINQHPSTVQLDEPHSREQIDLHTGGPMTIGDNGGIATTAETSTWEAPPPPWWMRAWWWVRRHVLRRRTPVYVIKSARITATQVEEDGWIDHLDATTVDRIGSALQDMHDLMPTAEQAFEAIRTSLRDPLVRADQSTTAVSRRPWESRSIPGHGLAAVDVGTAFPDALRVAYACRCGETFQWTSARISQAVKGAYYPFAQHIYAHDMAQQVYCDDEPEDLRWLVQRTGNCDLLPNPFSEGRSHVLVGCPEGAVPTGVYWSDPHTMIAMTPEGRRMVERHREGETDA